jgi:hypothetical protein
MIGVGRIELVDVDIDHGAYTVELMGVYTSPQKNVPIRSIVARDHFDGLKKCTDDYFLAEVKKILWEENVQKIKRMLVVDHE